MRAHVVSGAEPQPTGTAIQCPSALPRYSAAWLVGPYFAAVNGDHHLGHNLGLSHIARAMSPEYQSDQHLCDRKTLAGDRKRRPRAGQDLVTPHGVSGRPRLPPLKYPRQQ